MADVAEEQRLGAIDLGQRLGALAFLFVGPRVGNRGRDLRRHQLEEAAILLVELETRADAGDQKSRHLMRFVRRDGQHHGSVRRVQPGTQRRSVEARADILHNLHSFRSDRLGKRPGLIFVQARNGRGDGVTHAGRAGEARLLALGIDEIEQRERHVLAMLRQGLGGDGAGLFGRLRFARAGAEVAQDHPPALADDLLGDFMHGRQHPADATRGGVVRYRAVGDGEVGLFDEAVPVDLEGNVLHPGRRPAVERRVDQRLKDMPDLLPAFADGLPKGPWVLRPEDRAVGIVIERDVLRSPPEKQGEPVGQHEPDHHPQRG
jgi:hypothetical protein